MTTLVSWVGVDQRGQASFYIASDSRITWGENESWNIGKKVFASLGSPDIFAYCGDVLLPSMVLSQVVDLADGQALYPDNSNPEDRAKHLESFLTSAIGEYPKKRINPFTILYATRFGSGVGCAFHLYRFDWSFGSELIRNKVEIPIVSDVALCLGTGKDFVFESHLSWKNAQGSTSRGVFSAFCDALLSKGYPRSGGAPQLVGIYREGTGRKFGVIFCDTTFFGGVQIKNIEFLQSLEWRNEKFERCDSVSRTCLSGAQKHPRPRNF